MARKLVVEIVGDSRSLERAFARSSRSASKFQASVTGVTRGISRSFAGLGVALGAGGIAVGLKKTVDAASSLNEEIAKSEQIFGSSADEIQAWSENSAESMKVSQTEALQATGNFGAMFRTIGLGTRRTADMSKRLAQLGADMASFNNEDPTAMLDRLRSGLAGEAEPLRRFGVLLSEARVKTEAYRSGIARAGSKLTEQQKVQARYNLILADTTLQQGDVARTGSQWAGTQRELSARIGDMAAKLGQVLLPAITNVVTQFNDWLADPQNQKRVIDGFTGAVEGLGSAIEGVAKVLGPLKTAWDAFWQSEDWMEKWSPTANEGARERVRKTVVKGFTDGLLAAVPDQTAIGKWAKRHQEALQTELDALTLEVPRVPDESDLATTKAAITAREKAAGKRRKAAPPTPALAPKGITAAQRNQWFDAGIARQLNRLQDLGLRTQLARLRTIAQEVRQRMTATKDATRRLTLEDKLLDIYREQRSIQEQIGDQIREANQALKDRAEAIKAAVLDRLQRRQTDILNKRALADAKEQLRIARQIGTGAGIRTAQRGLQDVRMDMLLARVQNAPATLGRGGQFQLAGVVININGVTDPAEVARRVEAILKKRNRRNTTSIRPTTATA